MYTPILLTLVALINLPGAIIKPTKRFSIFAFGFALGMAFVQWVMYFKGAKL